MKHVDDVRGFERHILFESTGGYKTSGGIALTNCVVEVVENNCQGNFPMISLRFFSKPYPRKLAEEMAEAGNPAYDDETQIGVEINLGPEMAQSFFEQIQAQWPEYVRGGSRIGKGRIVSNKSYGVSSWSGEGIPVSKK